MIRKLLLKIVDRENLTVDEMEAAMGEIMEGQVSNALIAAFITALRMKGETVDEITGAAKVMRRKVTRIPLKDAMAHIISRLLHWESSKASEVRS